MNEWKVLGIRCGYVHVYKKKCMFVCVGWSKCWIVLSVDFSILPQGVRFGLLCTLHSCDIWLLVNVCLLLWIALFALNSWNLDNHYESWVLTNVFCFRINIKVDINYPYLVFLLLSINHMCMCGIVLLQEYGIIIKWEEHLS